MITKLVVYLITPMELDFATFPLRILPRLSDHFLLIIQSFNNFSIPCNATLAKKGAIIPLCELPIWFSDKNLLL